MKLHRNAKTTPMSRAQLVGRVLHAGWTYQQAADGSGVSRRTVAKWVQRFRTQGVAGLEDRSSRPRRTPHSTAADGVVQIQRLRAEHQLPAWAIGRARPDQLGPTRAALLHRAVAWFTARRVRVRRVLSDMRFYNHQRLHASLNYATPWSRFRAWPDEQRV